MLAELVLRHPGAWRALGDWETRLLTRQLAQVSIDRPVFIAGLARAGTTVLLRKLCELPGFVSHRYADFPFLFTPYAWSRLRRPRPEVPRERMHADRIMVTAESPEAMEEVLWTAFFAHLHDPARSNVLDGIVRRPDFDAFFADHIRKLLLARGGRRYVSKNNYNVTRLGYLARLFPDARFIVPVRDPVAHVASLAKQHALFSRIQRESASVRRRLALVGHFEFGLDRRPINPGDDGAIASIQACWDREEDARGWARYWALIYRHLLQRFDADPDLARRTLLLRYEVLCDQPEGTALAIARHTGVVPAEARRLATGLAAPDYYVPAFTPEELAAIAEETELVVRRLARLRLNDRARSPGPSLAAASSSSPPES
ncbi:MAG: sulfotransferase [Acetobacteraceae bacterium]|nr:sulfotransferase [Acetobacteraceae bacterium]